MLDRRGVVVVPDILANAGGVTASYFEWAQAQQGYPWEDHLVAERLRQRMEHAFTAVGPAQTLDVGMRTAAHVVAVERVADAITAAACSRSPPDVPRNPGAILPGSGRIVAFASERPGSPAWSGGHHADHRSPGAHHAPARRDGPARGRRRRRLLQRAGRGLVRRRHRELQASGLDNAAIFDRIAAELAAHGGGAPPVRRQLRRIVYG